MAGTEDDADVTRLRSEFPGWEIRSYWQGAASGPEPRQLRARRDGVTVLAWDEAALRRAIGEAGG